MCRLKIFLGLMFIISSIQMASAFPMIFSKKITMVDPEISVKQQLKDVDKLRKSGQLKPDGTSGFKVARTGIPNLKKFQEMCKLGIRRMIVMSGNGSVEENFANSDWDKKECPGFKVVYNQEQRTGIPLSKNFLAEFDKHIEEAKAAGVGLAFRCNCGCHRTGRLAAYYRMKHLKKTAEESVKDQRWKAGLASVIHRKNVKFQIKGLEDYINGKPCSVKNLESDKHKFCVAEDDSTPLSSVPRDEDDENVVDEDDDSLGNDDIAVNGSSLPKTGPSPASVKEVETIMGAKPE